MLNRFDEDDTIYLVKSSDKFGTLIGIYDKSSLAEWIETMRDCHEHCIIRDDECEFDGKMYNAYSRHEMKDYE